jgi:hypothetical protein
MLSNKELDETNKIRQSLYSSEDPPFFAGSEDPPLWVETEPVGGAA